MTRKQILDAITPLSHLNRWARTTYEVLANAPRKNAEQFRQKGGGQ